MFFGSRIPGTFYLPEISKRKDLLKPRTLWKGATGEKSLACWYLVAWWPWESVGGLGGSLTPQLILEGHEPATTTGSP